MALATSREDEGSIVEQSIKRRSEFETCASESRGLSSWPKTFFTCIGSGSTVIVISYSNIQLAFANWMISGHILVGESSAASRTLVATCTAAPLDDAFVSLTNLSAELTLIS